VRDNGGPTSFPFYFYSLLHAHPLLIITPVAHFINTERTPDPLSDNVNTSAGSGDTYSYHGLPPSCTLSIGVKRQRGLGGWTSLPGRTTFAASVLFPGNRQNWPLFSPLTYPAGRPGPSVAMLEGN